jgi:hypothetical protein
MQCSICETNLSQSLVLIVDERDEGSVVTYFIPMQALDPREKDVMYLSLTLYVSGSHIHLSGSNVNGSGKTTGSVFCRYWPDVTVICYSLACHAHNLAQLAGAAA